MTKIEEMERNVMEGEWSSGKCRVSTPAFKKSSGCLSILEHVAEPPLVSNCSAAVLRCRLDTAGPNIEVWWTFHGENASKLPNVVLEPPPSRESRAASSVAPPVTTPPATAVTPGATTTPSNASAHNSTLAHNNSTSSSNETWSGTEPPTSLTTPGGDVFSGEDAENVTTASPQATTTLSSGEAASSEVESSSSAEDEEKSAVWTLRLNCPTLEHAGSYACYALSRNASEFIYKKEASLDVYVPVSVEVEQSVVEATVNSSVTLSCLATGHPKVTTLLWSRASDDDEQDDPAAATGNSTSSEDVTFGSRLIDSTNVTQVSEVQYRAQLTLESLQRRDNGTYVCYAGNEYNMTMAVQDVLVLGAVMAVCANIREKGPTGLTGRTGRHSPNTAAVPATFAAHKALGSGRVAEVVSLLAAQIRQTRSSGGEK
ncbi:hypothetical protein MTO96_047917 [Rhipicephalus appendiculatus]